MSRTAAVLDDHEEFVPEIPEPCSTSYANDESKALSSSRIAAVQIRATAICRRSDRWYSNMMDTDDFSWSIPEWGGDW